jgi:DNA-binding NarL/FixJ family response regulator
MTEPDQPPGAPIRIVVADDESMVRAGLRLVMQSEPDIEVVGEASDGLHAVDVVRRTRPQVVLMDIRMPRLDGLAAAARILENREDAPRIVMLTTFDEEASLFEALRIGASGFLLKVSPPEQLLEAIRAVAAGRALIDTLVTRRVIESFARGGSAQPPPAELDDLTPREREVLELVARGRTNSEIAGELFVGEATVKTHVNRILSKLGLAGRVQAVVFAYESGIVRPGEQ